jgi:hypothetical protein
LLKLRATRLASISLILLIYLGAFTRAISLLELGPVGGFFKGDALNLEGLIGIEPASKDT